jgi:hypothetical protein
MGSNVRENSLRPLLRPFALLAIASLAGACTCGRSGSQHDPVFERHAFGEVPTADGVLAPDVDLQPYLDAARALLINGDRAPIDAIPPLPGRRVFLTVYQEKHDASVTSAVGDTLAHAVLAAAQAAAKQLVQASIPVRLQIDVVTAVTPSRFDVDTVPPLADLGVDGYALGTDAEALGWVTPTEIIVGHYFNNAKSLTLEYDRLQRLINGRAGAPVVGDSRAHVYTLRTESRVESSPPGGALPLYRGMTLRPQAVTPELLLHGVRLGADYLLRVINDAGRYVYMYHPVEDRDDTIYGMLRHCGTTYALLEAYGEFHTPLYLQKAERAIGYAKLRMKAEGSGAETMRYVIDTNDEEQQKVGGAGLALVMMTEYASVSGDRADVDTMRSLARYIVHQQYPDGRFRANLDVEREEGKKGLKKEVLYYPGEGILGLVRLYAIDQDVRWLEAAQKGADYCVEIRDAAMTEETQEHDHWLSYALNELYRVTNKQSYVDHAYKIARAIVSKQRTKDTAPAPDWIATFFNGETTPGSTRLEAFSADLALTRFLNKDEAWLMAPAQELGKQTLGQQLDEPGVFFAKNPAKALGGVRESLYIEDVRIDYVQHAMSAWLHLGRLLRDPAYGKTGSPSQDPPLPPSTPNQSQR